MLPDRVSNPGPLTYESGALSIALRGPAFLKSKQSIYQEYEKSGKVKISTFCKRRKCIT